MNVFELCAKIVLDKKEYEKGLNDAKNETSSLTSKVGGVLGNVGKATASAVANIAKVSAVATGVVATGVGALTKSVVESYADYEQLVGGVETLFKDSADVVQNYANEAYKTAGLSANEYMESVTGFSASLLQGLGGDTAKASEVANRAIIDMSDNANKMGTSMESIQNAYQGFAKQNYTMLDNLKLGYGGTKEEMSRLIEDASKMTDVQKELGVSVDASSMSFDNIINAISVMQQSLGIAGTTAKEAGSTISGSINMMKSAWKNLITGIGSDNADFDKLIGDVVDSAETALSNLMPRIEKTIKGISTLVTKIAPIIAEKLPALVQSILPPLLESASSIISSLAEALPSLIVSLLPTLIEALVMVINAISQQLPTIIQSIITALISNLPMIIQGLITLVMAIVNSIPSIILPLIESLPQIIEAVINGLIEALPQLIVGLINLVILLVEHTPEIIMALLEAIPLIIEAIITAFAPLASRLIQFMSEMWQKIKDKFAEAGENLKAKIKEMGEFFNELPTKLGYYLGVAVSKFVTFITDLALKVIDIRDKVIAKIVEFFAQLPSKIYTHLVNVVQKFTQFITDLKNKVATGIPELVSDFINAFNELPSQIMDVGRNVVQGLWDGIKEKWSAMFSELKTKIAEFKDAFKEGFDTHSPSRWFRWLGEMNVKGFEQGMAELLNPTGLANSIQDSLKTISAVDINGANSTKGLGASTYNQTININQQISTADELARKVRLESRYGLMKGVALG